MRRELHALHVLRLKEFIGRLGKGLVHADSVPLQARCRVSDTAVPFARRRAGRAAFRPIAAGAEWGHAWQSAWFHVTGRVPEGWAGTDVALRFNANGEALVFDGDGQPRYGLTGGSIFDGDYCKDIYRLHEPCRGGERVDLWIEATASGLFGIKREPGAGRLAPGRHGHYSGRLVTLELVRFDTAVWHLWLDMRVLLDLQAALPADAPRRVRLIEAMSRAIDVFGENRARAAAARAVLAQVMALPPNPADLDVTAVGHAHIDVGWLWPVRESIRKTARTFASQLALIERYPGYVFGASQPQLYAFVKEHYPALYARVKQAVKRGRWECQGAMWVEADCNVPSGESLARQILHGKNFFRDEFGVDVRNLWLPDVFGYSAALPQILRRAGVDFFLTQKLSWSVHNEFPFNTFRWRGIDGSEVVTHFPPENTYNGSLLPGPLLEAQRRFKENGLLDGFASLFGIGDGGGGPREEHVEQGLRCRALNGCPRVRFGTAESYFKRLRARAGDLESWEGELYLEKHRGTLTTQAAVKRGNRKLELKLRETEMFLAMLPLADYPRADLDRIWKRLLINQFHDILPGSSIRLVYEDTVPEHAAAMAECDRLIARAARRLLPARRDALTLMNSLGVPFTAPTLLPADWKGHTVLDAEGRELPAQDEAGGVAVAVTLPPYSLTTVRRGPARRRAPARAGAASRVLENDLIRYEFDERAVVTRIYDKQRRAELLAGGGQGNLLALYEDRPHNFDAWDVDIWYRRQFVENARPIAWRRCCDGPVRQGLRFELAVGAGSRLTQQVTLAAHSRRLDFETQADWREAHRMLRVSFATGVRAAEAACDIQYGYLRRPTHANTSWDMARFEVPAHRYVDLSDLEQGMALLNDCKYGYRIAGGVLDLNLLRSPTDPDPDADLGRHLFTYSLLPHAGTLVESDVMAQAAMLNQPPLALPGRSITRASALPCRLEAEGISLEVLKKAEKEECLVLRLVETRGCHSSGVLTLPAGSKLIPTDLMEWRDGRPLAAAGGQATVTLAPFEIRTYKVVPAVPRRPRKRVLRHN